MIADDMVVTFNYTLKDDEGTQIDSSDGDPLEYLHGHQNIVPGLEKALAGLAVGAKKQVVVSPAEGYGEYDEELVMALDRQQFGSDIPDVGVVVELRAESGDVLHGVIAAVNEREVVINANHPLAGKALHFDVEIVGVREATAEELEHGHPHGAHGHHGGCDEESCGDCGCDEEGCGEGGCGDCDCDEGGCCDR